MGKQDIRWQQRFSNFRKAFAKLSETVLFVKDNYFFEGEFDESSLSGAEEIVIEGLIKKFEYTHELAWNVMKDFIEERGNASIYGSKDATREAFQLDLIQEGDVWMAMIRSRNKTVHSYDEAVAKKIFLDILGPYFPAFGQFEEMMSSIQNEGKNN